MCPEFAVCLALHEPGSMIDLAAGEKEILCQQICFEEVDLLARLTLEHEAVDAIADLRWNR